MKLNIKNELKNINYDNLTYNELVKIKLACYSTENAIKNALKDMSGFTEITTGAFGYINNPYSRVTKTFNSMLSIIKSIKENLSEQHILSLVQFANKKQTFNIYTVLGRYQDIAEYLKEFYKFDEAQKLYNKAVKDRTNIFSKYLGFKADDFNKIDTGYTNTDASERFKVLTITDKDNMRFKEYSFDKWELWTSSSLVKLDDELFSKAIRDTFPEEFI